MKVTISETSTTKKEIEIELPAYGEYEGSGYTVYNRFDGKSVITITETREYTHDDGYQQNQAWEIEVENVTSYQMQHPDKSWIGEGDYKSSADRFNRAMSNTLEFVKEKYEKLNP